MSYNTIVDPMAIILGKAGVEIWFLTFLSFLSADNYSYVRKMSKTHFSKIIFFPPYAT